MNHSDENLSRPSDGRTPIFKPRTSVVSARPSSGLDGVPRRSVEPKIEAGSFLRRITALIIVIVIAAAAGCASQGDTDAVANTTTTTENPYPAWAEEAPGQFSTALDLSTQALTHLVDGFQDGNRETAAAQCDALAPELKDAVTYLRRGSDEFMSSFLEDDLDMVIDSWLGYLDDCSSMASITQLEVSSDEVGAAEVRLSEYFSNL